eukprot:gene46292-62704_t
MPTSSPQTKHNAIRLFGEFATNTYPQTGIRMRRVLPKTVAFPGLERGPVAEWRLFGSSAKLVLGPGSRYRFETSATSSGVSRQSAVAALARTSSADLPPATPDATT